MAKKDLPSAIRRPIIPSAASLFTLGLILAVWLLSACGGNGPTYEDGLNEGLRKGWEAGAKAMAQEIADQARNLRRKLRQPMRGRLTVLAVVTAILTLFGAKWVDAARQALAARFKVPMPMQARIAAGLYLAVATALLWYGVAKCGMRDSVPVMILVGGSLIPFLDYRSALLEGDTQRRRLAFTRAKAMLMLALVVIVILRILSDDGFLNIQLGARVMPPPLSFSREAGHRSGTPEISIAHRRPTDQMRQMRRLRMSSSSSPRRGNPWRSHVPGIAEPQLGLLATFTVPHPPFAPLRENVPKSIPLAKPPRAPR